MEKTSSRPRCLVELKIFWMAAFITSRENKAAALAIYPMMTLSNGNIFRVTGHLCGEFTGPGEFPTQRPVTWSFDVYFDLRPNKRLSKQSLGWWFETLSPPLLRHRNAFTIGVWEWINTPIPSFYRYVISYPYHALELCCSRDLKEHPKTHVLASNNQNSNGISHFCLAVPKPENLALNKPTWQIDDYRPDFKSRKSVDGNNDPVLDHKFCSCTNSRKMAWWAVDLKKIYVINKVAITNREAAGKQGMQR